ncbi:MAG: DUF3108 domain-containing protein [Verrucomicrobiota bacterium]|nr:DUF3108 domain-containing protein [Verrucomicrobiota bacterium]
MWPALGADPALVSPAANTVVGRAQAAHPAATGLADTHAPATNAALPSFWFPVGEELHYHIMWAKALVGRATIITAWTREGDRPLLKVAYWARSNRALSKIYPVNDLIVALIDPATFRPVRFDLNLKEGKFHRKETTLFDYETKTAIWTSAVKNKARTFPIEDDTRDLVTFMYYMRSKEFRAGTNLNERVMADDKIYDLHILADRDETVQLPNYGQVNCLRLEPTAEFDGIFVRSGKVSMWVSRDSRNLCAMLKAEAPVGSVQAVLSRVRGPGDDFWIKRLNESNPLP